MSRRRRILCLVTGILVVLWSLMMGLTGLFLSSRVGNPHSMETAVQLIEDMKMKGAVFNNEDEVRSLLFRAIYSEIQRGANAQVVGDVMTGVFGFFIIVFALWPSRKKQSTAVQHTEK